MLRHLAWVLAMAAFFVAPFYWIGAPPFDQRPTPVEVGALERAPALRFSTHAKPRRPARDRAGEIEVGRLDREVQTRPSPPLRTDPRPGIGTKTELVSFESAPFPYTGREPRSNRPFLNVSKRGRRGRRTRGGRLYWADRTYSDSRVLLHIPEGFDANRPAVMLLFFHGHGATLERDVGRRQRLPEQIDESGMNAVLVAPQFAVDARDSSAGKFWQPGGVRRFLEESAEQLAELHGDPGAAEAFAEMPVVIVGYSGGYVPTAFALDKGGIEKRVKGVVLLDGLYGEVGKFARWIDRDDSAFFVSAYTRSTSKGNAALKQILAKRRIPYSTALEPELQPNSVTFVRADFRHRHYVTRAWAESPISDLLARMTDKTPRVGKPLWASLSPWPAR